MLSVLVQIALTPCAFAEGTGALEGEPWPRHVVDDSGRGADGVRLADANGDGLPDIATGWEEEGVTRVYLHPGYGQARDPWPAATVGPTPSVEDAVWSDLDGDGALDVISCCEGREQRIHVHWGPRDPNRLLDPTEWRQAAIPASDGAMKWMFACPVQIDGRRGPDIVAAGKGEGAALGWFQAARRPRALRKYTWHPISPVGWIMSIRLTDMDGDGDEDVAISDRRGALRGCRWLENPGAGPAQTQPWRNHLIGAREKEVMFMAVADLDEDGLQDIVTAVKPNLIIWCRRLDECGDSWEEHAIPYPPDVGTAKGAAVGDIDGDGPMDVVLSCEHAHPPKSGVICLANRGADGWIAHDVSGPRGIKFDRLELMDVDDDGDLDVLTCEEQDEGRGLGVVWYENPTGGD